MKKVFKFFGLIFCVMLVLGLIGNLMGLNDETTTEPKEEPKMVEKQEEKPKEEPKKTEKSKEEPKKEEPKIDPQIALEKAYITEYTEIVGGTSNMMFALSDMFAQPSVEPTLMFDENWRQGIVDVYVSIGNFEDRLLSLEVPDSLKEVHDLTVKSFASIMQSEDKVLRGIDTLDTEQFYQAMDLIEQSTEYTKQATAKIDEIIKSRGY